MKCGRRKLTIDNRKFSRSESRLTFDAVPELGDVEVEDEDLTAKTGD